MPLLQLWLLEVFFFLVFLFFCPVYLCVNVCLLCTWLISAPAFNHLISCRTATFLPFFTTPLNQLQWFHLLCGSLLHFCKFASSPRALCNTITCPPHDFPVLLLPPQLWISPMLWGTSQTEPCLNRHIILNISYKSISAFSVPPCLLLGPQSFLWKTATQWFMLI